MNARKFCVVIQHPDGNEFITTPNHELPYIYPAEGDTEASSVSKLLCDYSLFLQTKNTNVCNKIVDKNDLVAFELDWTYLMGLPPDKTGSKLDFTNTKIQWTESKHINDDCIHAIEATIVNSPLELLLSIKLNMDHLEWLMSSVSDHWSYEDMVYRFYHQSFKVYNVQYETKQMVHWFKRIASNKPLNAQFMEIVMGGTGKRFELCHNKEWTKYTRPLIEAFFHAKFFLEMMIKYGKELDNDVRLMPSGYAAMLYLYNMR